MSVKCQVNVKSQSELDIGGCETCHLLLSVFGLSLFGIESLDLGLVLWTGLVNPILPNNFLDLSHFQFKHKYF